MMDDTSRLDCFQYSNDEMKLKIDVLLQEIETYKQENHELHMKINNLQLTEKEALNEVVILQDLLSQEKENRASAVSEMEEKLSNCRNIWQEKVDCLEQELQEQTNKYEDEVAKLQQQIRDLQNMSVSLADTTRQMEDMFLLKNKNAALEQSLEEWKEKAVNQALEIQHLNEKITSLEQELEREREIAGELKEEIKSSRIKLENVQEELCMARLQVEEAKVQGHSKKGNSIFAEVEEHRKMIQKKYDILKNKYACVKNQYNLKCCEVSKLRAAKTSFHQLYDKIIKECKKFDSELVESYKVRIQELEKNVSDKCMSEGRLSAGPDSLKWVDHLVQNKDKEIQELKKCLEELSLNKLLEAESLHMTRKELCVEKARALKLELDLQSLEKCNCKNGMLPEVNDTDSNKALQNEKKVILDKENIPPKDQKTLKFNPNSS